MLNKLQKCAYLFFCKIEIRFVKQGICLTATLYILAVAYKGCRCKQIAIIFHGAEL